MYSFVKPEFPQRKPVRKHKLPEQKIYKAGDIEYTTRFSRRKTLGISIHPDLGVVARVPYRTPEKIIQRVILAKSGWIRKVLEYHRSLKKIDNNKMFSDGESVFFRGKDHFLKISQSDKYYVSRKDDNIIEIGIKGEADPEIIKSLLEHWYKNIAKQVFAEKYKEILMKYRDYNFSPSSFSVRTMKKRWGSCTSKGKIAISYDLIRLDEIYGEYVIIQELCRLKQHNHGAEYYKLLTEVFPKWKSIRKELKKFIR